jgi:gas vesicle protein
MGQDPEAIRREIEETRERMGETVEALGYKADVPTRTKEAVSGKVSSVKEKIVGAAGSAQDSVSGAAGTVNERTPSTGDVKQAARKGASVAQENPLGLALGSVAIGFLAGMLIPSTRVENEKLGPMADQVKDQAQSTAQEALEHGKQVAQDVASTAQEHAQQAVSDVKDTAQQSAQEHGQQVKESAQDNAQQVRQQV